MGSLESAGMRPLLARAATATLFAVLCCIGAHTPVTAQVRETLWQVTAAPPEPGPLLFFISPEGSLPRREEVHYVMARHPPAGPGSSCAATATCASSAGSTATRSW